MSSNRLTRAIKIDECNLCFHQILCKYNFSQDLDSTTQIRIWLILWLIGYEMSKYELKWPLCRLAIGQYYFKVRVTNQNTINGKTMSKWKRRLLLKQRKLKILSKLKSLAKKPFWQSKEKLTKNMLKQRNSKKKRLNWWDERDGYLIRLWLWLKFIVRSHQK